MRYINFFLERLLLYINNHHFGFAPVHFFCQFAVLRRPCDRRISAHTDFGQMKLAQRHSYKQHYWQMAQRRIGFSTRNQELIAFMYNKVIFRTARVGHTPYQSSVLHSEAFIFMEPLHILKIEFKIYKKLITLSFHARNYV